MRITQHVMTALVAVFLCACNLTPEYCRSLYVDVPDGAKPTGKVIREIIKDEAEVQAICGAKGCTKMLRPGEWVIISIDDNIIRQHEYCHARFQRIGHTE